MKALILAAGYATRLYPLTKKYPKPLLKVKNKPIIDHIIDKLRLIKQIDEIIVVTNSKFIGKFKEWRSGVKEPEKITLVDDRTKSNTDRLGAMGDISFVLNKRHIKDDLLIIGGDNLFSGSLKGFINFALRKNPDATIGAYKLKNIKDASKYGVVKINRKNKVIGFQEKPVDPKSPLVAMCLYFIPAGQFSLINDYMKIRKGKSDATGKYIDWLKNKKDIYCFIFKGSWYDIGDYKYLNAAKRSFA
ncbi:MAG: nucleotidyltransferase family protein [Candidatus Omnitrophota bacterium]